MVSWGGMCIYTTNEKSSDCQGLGLNQMVRKQAESKLNHLDEICSEQIC